MTFAIMDLPKGETPPEKIENPERQQGLPPPFDNDEFLRIMPVHSRDIDPLTTRHVYASPFGFYKGLDQIRIVVEFEAV